MKTWISLARQSNVSEILSFCDTIENHLMGIVYHAKFPISSGNVEGVNNMIKTIRRKAYGYRDTEYFFLKIRLASMRGAYTIHTNPTLSIKMPEVCLLLYGGEHAPVRLGVRPDYNIALNPALRKLFSFL